MSHCVCCQVLATGLSGLYSSLPTKLEVPGEDWHGLHREDWLHMPALVQFLNSLEFCNAVIQVSAWDDSATWDMYSHSVTGGCLLLLHWPVPWSPLFPGGPPGHQRPAGQLHLQRVPGARPRSSSAQGSRLLLPFPLHLHVNPHVDKHTLESGGSLIMLNIYIYIYIYI